MSALLLSLPELDISPPLTVQDVIERFPGIAATRIRLHPAPGLATEDDVVRIHDQEDRLFELVEGTLVEKSRWRNCSPSLMSAGDKANFAFGSAL